MIERIKLESLYKTKQGDVESIFHFSFAEYYDPNNIRFGPLRVMNDDIIASGVGFPMHPHSNMEIISLCVTGELTHGDSMGNEETLKRGDIQYMSAGTGVFHSEYNRGENPGRFIQIWILPDKNGYEPNYGSKQFTYEEMKNKLLKIVSSKIGDAPVKINQNVEIYMSELECGREIEAVTGGKNIYFKQIEGESELNGILINEKEAAKVYDEEKLTIKARSNSLIMVIIL